MTWVTFTNLWTLSAAARDTHSWSEFIQVVWENTSGYLLMSLLFSLMAAVASWLYVGRTGPEEGQQPQRVLWEQQHVEPAADSELDRQEPSSTTEPLLDGVSGEDSGDDIPDLVDMAHHLPARIKRAELRSLRRKVEQDMDDEQRQMEIQTQSEQMTAILELMQRNSDKFGSPSMEEMQSQMRLYM